MKKSIYEMLGTTEAALKAEAETRELTTIENIKLKEAKYDAYPDWKKAFIKWNSGTTCNLDTRKEVYMVSKCGRFAVFKHKAHREWVGGFTKYATCPTYYELVECSTLKSIRQCGGRFDKRLIELSPEGVDFTRID